MTYCISDIHGCFNDFMTLLEKIKFNPKQDIIYILGDVIDRGQKPIECLQFIMKTNHIHFLMGNHERMMLDFHESSDNDDWIFNGYETTLDGLLSLNSTEANKIITYLQSRKYYKTVNINGKRYFLSHAGLEAGIPFSGQDEYALVWLREEFFGYKTGLHDYTCIFGHTPTKLITGKSDVWFDDKYGDKINIDCGCAYGGRLAALCLDNLSITYSKDLRYVKTVIY